MKKSPKKRPGPDLARLSATRRRWGVGWGRQGTKSSLPEHRQPTRARTLHGSTARQRQGLHLQNAVHRRPGPIIFPPGIPGPQTGRLRCGGSQLAQLGLGPAPGDSSAPGSLGDGQWSQAARRCNPSEALAPPWWVPGFRSGKCSHPTWPGLSTHGHSPP